MALRSAATPIFLETPVELPLEYQQDRVVRVLPPMVLVQVVVVLVAMEVLVKVALEVGVVLKQLKHFIGRQNPVRVPQIF